MKKLRDIDGLEDEFKNWIIDSGGAEGTAKSYWERIRDFKFFQLQEMNERKISGQINKQLSRAEEKTAINQFLEFLFEEYEKDQASDEQYEDLRYKKNAVQSNLEVPKKERNRDTDIDVKKHYMHKDELVRLLEEAEPVRARMYYLLYSGGFRIGELKRLTMAHLREGYGDHGAIKVPSSRSKSKDARTVKFKSEYPLQVFLEAPIGRWESDENGKKWSQVFFPENYAQLENYYLKKYCGQIGLEPRTSHSFRHIRITDLIQATDMKLEMVQTRSGHDITSSSTNDYNQAAFDREPQTLEQYIEENDVDIIDVIQS